MDNASFAEFGILGFLTSIFGDGQNNIWNIVMVLAVVLVLIVLSVWALKLVFRASSSISRGRQRRLAVIDTVVLDAKRSLILIRRDNVEHLIMSNGANDVVVESGIVVPEPASAAPRNGASGKSAANGEQDAAAQRLGLSNILTRSKGAGTRKEPPVYPRPGPKTRPLKPQPTSGKPESTSLRHTGLLRPTSEMETVFPLEEQDNVAPENNDSDMNELQQVDAQAMVSVEEGANPVNVDAQIKPPRKQAGQGPGDVNIAGVDENAGGKSR